MEIKKKGKERGNDDSPRRQGEEVGKTRLLQRQPVGEDGWAMSTGRKTGGRESLRHGGSEKGQEEARWGDVSCADGLREHRSKFHAVMSLQKQEM